MSSEIALVDFASQHLLLFHLFLMKIKVETDNKPSRLQFLLSKNNLHAPMAMATATE
jgi:hypothetical protein